MEVDYHEVITIDEQELTTMRDDMKDRGPDGKGVWIAKKHDVALAHCRLSLIDLPDNGAQSMTDGVLMVVFDGEIYNY